MINQLPKAQHVLEQLLKLVCFRWKWLKAAWLSALGLQNGRWISFGFGWMNTNWIVMQISWLPTNQPGKALFAAQMEPWKQTGYWRRFYNKIGIIKIVPVPVPVLLPPENS